MTTTTDSAGHPDVSEISDLTEGLLSPSRTLDVRRHLDDCPLCTDVYESLEEIRGMLGTLPGPPRMPTDVAERIDAALAAEALLDATAVVAAAAAEPTAAATAPATDGSAEGFTDGSADDDAAAAASRRETVVEPAAHVSRETSTATSATPTAAASASGASSAGATHNSDARGPAGHPRAATGPGRSSRLRNRRRTAVLGAVFTAAALGLGTLLIQPWSSDSKESSNSASTGNDSTFAKGKLGGQVSDLLAGEQAAAGTDGGSSKPSYDVRSSPGEGPSKGSKMRGESYTEVPACVEKGLGGRTPLAADKGTYEGKIAYLVVVPHDSDSAKVSAYVVDGTCVDASAAPDATGKVLLTESYARP
ncbi:hypothetical protein ABT390_11670 [Streptomyces aurantiacus]|uniref:Zinc-finger domain-containing protein n=1 Tax=Streptomyces aurantiacus JA 4570 TaxID=1286094 RepID=S3ZBI5_9ACTN|nr:hypothetical protein [Streptomyces aurantiacus]EPH40488.1 hypothetical protein STRAU_6525 [Streptomyces aurantiacus JA 4570]